MTLRMYRTFQALIMGGLGLYLFLKVMDGRILYYINQRFVILVLLGALGLIFIAQLVLRERPTVEQEDAGQEHDHDHDHDHPHHADENSGERKGWALWLLALPLLFGILIPERSLSVSALQTRGINTSANLSIRGGSTRALEIPSSERSVLDWLRVVGENPDPAVFAGQTADVTGFVYHDIRLGKDQFMVGRFSIACCVADAVALGMVANWPEAANLPDNRWVRVRGTVTLMELEGRNLPAIDVQSVEVIPEPSQPYLFP
jgi:putative membrane protein